MFDSEPLSLGQSFPGDDRDLDRGTLARPVEDQILDIIGRLAFKRGGDLAALFVAGRPRGMHLGIEDLAVGQDQLGRHAHRRQPKCCLAQIVQRLPQIGGIEGDLTDGKPAFRRPVQKRDGFAGQVKCKCRFHVAGLARILEVLERAPAGCSCSKAAFRRREGKGPRNWL